MCMCVCNSDSMIESGTSEDDDVRYESLLYTPKLSIFYYFACTLHTEAFRNILGLANTLLPLTLSQYVERL